MKHATSSKFRFDGLSFAPSQVWGSVRLIPLIRNTPIEDLRISKREYEADFSMVKSGRGAYLSNIPHGLVLDWGQDNSFKSSFGSKFEERKAKKAERRDKKTSSYGDIKIGLHDKMIKRENRNRLRLLPMHFSMEGLLLSMCKSPEVMWKYFHHHILEQGARFACTTSISGWGIPSLAGALEHFEIHENQVGVLVFVGDALASTFILTHPEDYRKLHRSIIQDFFSEVLWYYGLLHDGVPCFLVEFDDKKVETLDDLEKEFEKVKKEWKEFQATMAWDIWNRSMFSEIAYKKGSYTLQRFIVNPHPEIDDLSESLSQLQTKDAHHIGEAILRGDGEIAYMKTYRLSRRQCNKLKYLSLLAKYNWNMRELYAGEGMDKLRFRNRLASVGLHYIANSLK